MGGHRVVDQDRPIHRLFFGFPKTQRVHAIVLIIAILDNAIVSRYAMYSFHQIVTKQKLTLYDPSICIVYQFHGRSASIPLIWFTIYPNADVLTFLPIL